MDRRVKERLVGASILVALIVLVVPELLSGPVPHVRPRPSPAHVAGERAGAVAMSPWTSAAAQAAAPAGAPTPIGRHRPRPRLQPLRRP